MCQILFNQKNATNKTRENFITSGYGGEHFSLTADSISETLGFTNV